MGQQRLQSQLPYKPIDIFKKSQTTTQAGSNIKPLSSKNTTAPWPSLGRRAFSNIPISAEMTAKSGETRKENSEGISATRISGGIKGLAAGINESNKLPRLYTIAKPITAPNVNAAVNSINTPNINAAVNSTGKVPNPNNYADDPQVLSFIEKFQERYPDRPFQSGHEPLHSVTGKPHEIDFETDNVIIEFKEGNGSGLTRQVRNRQDPGLNPDGKVVIGVSGKKPSRFAMRDVEAEGGLLTQNVDDVLDLIAPDPVPSSAVKNGTANIAESVAKSDIPNVNNVARATDSTMDAVNSSAIRNTTTELAESAAKNGALNALGGVAKYGGKALGVLGTVMDVKDLYDSYQEDGGKIGENTVTTAGGIAGGSAGGALGAKGGALIGTMICPGIGTVVGGLLGGLVGGLAGSWFGEKAAGSIYDTR